jgi:hypothetical protein
LYFLLQLFGVVTAGKNFGQPELAAWILPNIAKPLKNSAILPGNYSSLAGIYSWFHQVPGLGITNV